MAFLKNSTSFTRFKVMDDVPAALHGEIVDRLRQFSFKDIDDLPEERGWGWASFEDMLDTHFYENPPKKGGEYIAFTLRLETRRVPPAVIKKHVGLAVKKEEAQAREQQGKSFISRERKKEIKEQVLFVLNKRFLPIPAEFQVIWNIQSGIVFFDSTQSKVLDLFQEHFVQTFDLHLEQLTPYGLAVELLGDSVTGSLDTLESSSFYKA